MPPLFLGSVWSLEGGGLLHTLYSGTFHVLDELEASLRAMIEA